MFSDIKPGHVIKFQTCPGEIASPHNATAGTQGANALETLWPATTNLGSFECISKPTGDLSDITAALIQSLNLPAADNLSQDRRVGQRLNCKFVGYNDGVSNYIQTDETVFSKDFSGCLFVAYKHNGLRRIAHVAAATSAHLDCKQAFLTGRQQAGDTLIGWFRPHDPAIDDARKDVILASAGPFYGEQHQRLVTFGVFTKMNHAYSITAFKPTQVVETDISITQQDEEVITSGRVASVARRVVGKKPKTTTYTHTTTTTTTNRRPYTGPNKTWIVVDISRRQLNTSWNVT